MSIKIDQALTQAFIDGDFGLPIAHENADYSPVSGTAYAEIKVIPNEAVPDTLGASGYDETTGLFQVTLRYPVGGYSITAKTKADEMMAYFVIGSEFTYSGQTVLITRKNRGMGYVEGGSASLNEQNRAWYKIILRFTFNARTVRTAA